MTRILAVDPGLANTGLVLFEGRRIAATRTIVSPAQGARPDFATSVVRAERNAAELRASIAAIAPVDVVVVETYVDIPGRLKTAVQNRWTTPLAIGLMVPVLRDATESHEIVWQDAAVVMTQYAQHVRVWAIGQRGLVVGDDKLKNEHQRSAAAHGLFYLDHAKRAVRS